jgi:hypothetical protein
MDAVISYKGTLSGHGLQKPQPSQRRQVKQEPTPLHTWQSEQDTNDWKIIVNEM